MDTLTAPEDPLLNDRLARSYSHIIEVVESAVNFQGLLETVIIDELQFALNLCGVVIMRNGRRLESNLSGDDVKILCKHFEKKEEKPSSETARIRLRMNEAKAQNLPPEMQTGKLTVSKLETLPIKDWPRHTYSVPGKATCRLSASHEDFRNYRIDLYYNPDLLINEGCQYFDLNSNHFLRLAELLAASIRLISEKQIVAESPAEPNTLTLLSHASSSQYLKIVLGKLKMSVLEHLSRRHSSFSIDNPFIVQYFTTYIERKNRVLRYFPLDDESEMLTRHEDFNYLSDQLSRDGHPLPDETTPGEFITNYDWSTENSFVGRTLNTKSALYIENWVKEPWLSKQVVSQESYDGRHIATTIMQHFRKDTPDQFIVPIFYRTSVIGLMLVNCPERIPEVERLGLIRSVHHVAPQIYMAIATDKEVNNVVEEKRKASESRAYKYVVNAMLHEEARFCNKILNHVSVQNENDEQAEQIHFLAKEKRQAVDEYTAAPSPLSRVDLALVYPDRDGSSQIANVTIDILNKYLRLIKAIYDPTQKLKIQLSFGPKYTERAAIYNLEKLIVARIIINLVKNARNAAQKRFKDGEQGELSLRLEIVPSLHEEYLEIKSMDNCGGFSEDKVKAWSKLTTENIIKYLNDKEEKSLPDAGDSPISSGMGLLIVSKYINSTEGVGTIRNISDGASRGAEVKIRLKLKPQLL
ncbi:MAG: ATP-binding protein [Verrucomicrobiota bacterium]